MDEDEIDYEDLEAQDFNHLEKHDEAAAPASGSKEPEPKKRISSQGF